MELSEKLQIIMEIKISNETLISEFINQENVQNELKSWSVEKFNAFAKELKESYTFQNLKKLYQKYKEQEGQ